MMERRKIKGIWESRKTTTLAYYMYKQTDIVLSLSSYRFSHILNDDFKRKYTPIKKIQLN